VAGRDGSLARRDGTAWTKWPVNFGASAIDAMWAASEDDIWAAGDGSDLLRWNGVSWTRVALGTTLRIRAIHGASASDISAVGDSGTILHFDGTARSTPANAPYINGDRPRVFGAAANRIWVLGESSVPHWNGIRWSTVDPA